MAAMNPVKSLTEADDVVGVPAQVVGTWTEAVLHKNGEGTRGFGGRLYFYERGSTKPIRVTGQLVVYAFEEHGRAAADNKPSKRYVFPAEQFAKHESQSEIGTSYSIWLPWDKAGGTQTEVSLIARFEPSQGGGLVVSDQTHHRLPGEPRVESLVAETAPASGIQQTSAAGVDRDGNTQAVYEKSDVKVQPRMTATTISLPGRFAKQGSQQAIQLPAGPVVSTAATAPSTSDAYQATPIGTSVQYLTPGESVRESVRQRSFGSSPQ